MSLIEPTSIAVIGASATEGKVGHDILKNLIEQGFKGEIYPVNPKGGEILGKQVFASISDVSAEIDLAVVVIPAKFVPDTLKECGENNIHNMVIISAGFSEVHTDEGKELEEQIKQIADEQNLSIIGPNCLGILRPSIGMNASFAKDLPATGNIALISQSGATAVALMDASPPRHLGYSFVASIGNKAVMDECHYLEMCEADEQTQVIGLYLESILDGKQFLKTAARVAKTKQIVLLKSGVSEHGKQAASSHTGALAGNDSAIDAACKQAGIHRAHNYEQFLDLLSVLSTQPTLLSRNIAIITNAGGPGILATDEAEKFGLELPKFEEKTLGTLAESLPAAAATGNPIDVIGDADAERYSAALNAVAEDPNIDGVVVLLTPQVMTPCDEIAQIIADVSKRYPLMPITTSFVGGESVETAREKLQEDGVPTFESPERAVQALAALLPLDEMIRDQTVLEKDQQRMASAESLLKGKSGLLDQPTTEQLLALYDLELPPYGIATTKEEALQIAEEIGYPVIAKICSAEIAHKTDVGGIKPNLEDEYDVETACKEIDGDVLIQKYTPLDSEFIIGSLRDPSFGALIMVGMGGIYTELFKDTTFRIAPVTEEESYEMLQELDAWQLLLGMRGKEQSDIKDLAHTLRKIAQLVSECPQIAELDINPVLVGVDKIVLADVKITL